MYVKAMVTECDFTERKYPVPVQGAWIVAQGATGRWCPVMYVGPEYLATASIRPISIQQAYDEIKVIGGYPDF